MQEAPVPNHVLARQLLLWPLLAGIAGAFAGGHPGPLLACAFAAAAGAAEAVRCRQPAANVLVLALMAATPAGVLAAALG